MATALQSATFVGFAPDRLRAPGFFVLLGRVLRVLDASDDRPDLHALSDHTLKDIGLTRDQLGAVHQGAADKAADPALRR